MNEEKRVWAKRGSGFMNESWHVWLTGGVRKSVNMEPPPSPIRSSVISSIGKTTPIMSGNQSRPTSNFLMSPPPVPPIHHATYQSIQSALSIPPAVDAMNESALSDALNKQSSNSDRTPVTPQSSRISGDIALTPMYSVFTPNINPHISMVPQTPITSGSDQVKNSIRLRNCVSTVNLSCELKLLDIYCKTRFSEYNPSRFQGVVMKILEPRATALVFRTGKIVCTGTRNEHDSLLATRKFARIIQKLGFPVKFKDFKVQNLVATIDIRFPIRLEALQQSHGQFSTYEPELFPGLVYRMIRPRVVLLIFVNGKIVFTGGKSRDDITESFNIIYPILRSFRKN